MKAQPKALELADELYRYGSINDPYEVADELCRLHAENEALRAALAEPALEPAPGYCKHCKQYTIEEPLQAEKPVALSQFLSDVVTAAGLLSHGKTDKALATRISEFVFSLRTAPQPRRRLTDEEIDAAWKNSEGCYGFARAIEAAIWSKT